MSSERTAGRATRKGTRRYTERFPGLPGAYDQPDSLWISSLALGTRNGEPGGLDDMLLRSAVSELLEGGVNLFVTALSDRLQTSERGLGVALARAFQEGLAARDEVVVATRGGYLTVDPELLQTPGQARRQLITTYVEPGLVDPDHIAQGVHCMDPPFLLDQIQRSRANLRLDTLDLYLLEDPELQLQHLGRDDFQKAIGLAFEALEQAVAEGWIAAYGLSTWDGLLLPHTHRHHLSILELFDRAMDVGGADHHLRAIQLPYNMATAEALKLPSQLALPGGPGALLEALRNTGTTVLASIPLAQGRILGRLPAFVSEALPGLESDAQRALQFVRSTPGVSAAVVGMRDPDHIRENLALLKRSPAEGAAIHTLFDRAAEASG